MPFRCKTFAVLLLLLAAGSICPAQAQIRRCVTPEGGHVYTDRSCKDLGASERGPRPTARSAQGGRTIRRDCSRSLPDLVSELSAAIDSRDVNRLAGIYHWPGMSARSAHAIMTQLDAVVNRPLVDIAPLHPPPPAPVPERPGAALTWQTSPRSTPAQTPGAVAASTAAASRREAVATVLPEAVRAAALRQQDARRAPTGLVVDQTASNRISSLQTAFSLHRHLGCWWVSLTPNEAR